MRTISLRLPIQMTLVLIFALLIPKSLLAQAANVPPAPAIVQSGATASLNLSVYIVVDLTPKPVPLTDFVVTDSAGTTTKLRTDLNGKATVVLPNGHYTLTSESTLSFNGQQYTWSKPFDISGGNNTDLSITQADAVVTGTAAASQTAGVGGEQGLSAGSIYKTDGPAVVSVQCDFGRGSGFLVDKKLGLFLTNAHVVNNTHQVAIRFDEGIRYPATVVLADKEADVAVVAVNPAVLTDSIQPIVIRDVVANPINEGDRVLAIGWPLDQDRIITEGIASRAEKDVIISDVNINHGSSGGPLLDSSGQAVGITTFLDSAENGPGISGIISISKATPVLASARQMVVSGNVPAIASYALPDIQSIAIEPASLEQAQQQDLKPWNIEAPRNFATQFYTPFVLASLENADERQAENGKSKRVAKRDSSDAVTDESDNPVHQYWRTFVGDGDPVVIIVIRPELKETHGSASRSIFGALIGGLAGVPIQTTHSYEFRDDFYDMQLWRGDHLILPISANRSEMTALLSTEYVHVNDEANAGIYEYDPSAFAPGDKLTVKMRRESDLATWDDIQVDDKTRSQIWDQFSGYRLANPADAVPQFAPADAELAALQQNGTTATPAASTTATTTPKGVEPTPEARTSYPPARH